MTRTAMYLLVAGIMYGCTGSKQRKDGWTEYLGAPDRNHYSSLSQINTTNVKDLQVVWEFHTGDSGQVQCNPIIVDSILYAVTASNYVFALDAATGKQQWISKISRGTSGNVNRGVAYWEEGTDKRILFAYGEWLTALNALTGEVITTFGNQGRVSLKSGLGEGVKEKYVGSTTPGAVFEDLIIMPIRVGEGEGAAPGYIQAFNIRTGKLAWVFHTIPQPGEAGYDTWPENAYKDETIGGANSWAGMAVDVERGIVFAPTGSPAFDFYGALRHGKNEYANSLIALDARTGKHIWHYQTVHHDIWDRDLPAPPNLVHLEKDGKGIDAVAQVTKTGFVFVFDRETGKSLYPITEKPFPASDVPGEQTWATQPIPSLPQPFARQEISENEISTIAYNREELLAIYHNASKGMFHPLEVDKPSIILPGADGGAEWGGAAVDKEGIMYVNANEMAWLFSLIKAPAGNLTQGQMLYNTYCISCHGANREGNPASGYPSLINIKQKTKREEIARLITNGRGMMPGLVQIGAAEKQAIIDFLFDEEKTEAAGLNLAEKSIRTKSPYRFNGYNKFLDSRGYPAITPPWGTLTAIDLNTGKQLWRQPLGEFKELKAEGHAATGTENYGGPIVTAGGVLFIAATKDGMFRAFDKKTGKLLFEKELPAAGFATPSTYQVNGRQYIVIACGGTKLGTAKGDSYVAFALP
ncbi:outer membrane protein assembly factor BamB family protein [Chitinophaga tropicalis]|nr:PQQ-binding-like beta-propeller repeat protein [Chitinophaga tropicalis]